MGSLIPSAGGKEGLRVDIFDDLHEKGDLPPSLDRSSRNFLHSPPYTQQLPSREILPGVGDG